jgi:hypothetical protein
VYHKVHKTKKELITTVDRRQNQKGKETATLDQKEIKSNCNVMVERCTINATAAGLGTSGASEVDGGDTCSGSSVGGWNRPPVKPTVSNQFFFIFFLSGRWGRFGRTVEKVALKLGIKEGRKGESEVFFFFFFWGKDPEMKLYFWGETEVKEYVEVERQKQVMG